MLRESGTEKSRDNVCIGPLPYVVCDEVDKSLSRYLASGAPRSDPVEDDVVNNGDGGLPISLDREEPWIHVARREAQDRRQIQSC